MEERGALGVRLSEGFALQGGDGRGRGCWAEEGDGAVEVREGGVDVVEGAVDARIGVG